MPKQNLSLFSDMFELADKKINDQSFSQLKASCEEKFAQGNKTDAILCAQKAIILYGILGMAIYIPMQLRLLQEEKNKGEIIEQALIGILALVLYTKEHNLNSIDKEEKENLESWQQQILLLADNPNPIFSEAELLSSYYLGIGY